VAGLREARRQGDGLGADEPRHPTESPSSTYTCPSLRIRGGGRSSLGARVLTDSNDESGSTCARATSRSAPVACAQRQDGDGLRERTSAFLSRAPERRGRRDSRRDC
jgi:hypothetical protein